MKLLTKSNKHHFNGKLDDNSHRLNRIKKIASRMQKYKKERTNNVENKLAKNPLDDISCPRIPSTRSKYLRSKPKITNLPSHRGPKHNKNFRLDNNISALVGSRKHNLSTKDNQSVNYLKRNKYCRLKGPASVTVVV